MHVLYGVYVCLCEIVFQLVNFQWRERGGRALACMHMYWQLVVVYYCYSSLIRNSCT